MRGWMGRRTGRPTLGQWSANHGCSLANWMRRSRRIGGRKIKESPLSALKRTPAIAAVVSRNPARSQSRTARDGEPTGTGLFFHLDWHLSATNSGHRTLLQASNEQDCLRFSSPVCLNVEAIFRVIVALWWDVAIFNAVLISAIDLRNGGFMRLRPAESCESSCKSQRAKCKKRKGKKKTTER